jgi:4-hydroxybenzoyl-CoA thioesterase
VSEDGTESARAFHSKILVRFAHCDPAGIVFYPRYMEMFNSLVEDWCRQGLEFPLPDLIASGWGIPAVHLNGDFVSPSMLGETLSASLSVRRLGESSVHLDILFRGPDGADRVRGKLVIVMTDLRTARARTIPDERRARISMFANPEYLHPERAKETDGPFTATSLATS